ncbi:hypothetical protein B6D29_00315 [Microgenomates bacterium UTCPR1]|nr:MAG: hypothetical protein B6D29_00315 [Microgenomates bacterium UTCPR1]
MIVDSLPSEALAKEGGWLALRSLGEGGRIVMSDWWLVISLNTWKIISNVGQQVILNEGTFDGFVATSHSDPPSAREESRLYVIPMKIGIHDKQ